MRVGDDAGDGNRSGESRSRPFPPPSVKTKRFVSGHEEAIPTAGRPGDRRDAGRTFAGLAALADREATFITSQWVSGPQNEQKAPLLQLGLPHFQSPNSKMAIERGAIKHKSENLPVFRSPEPGRRNPGDRVRRYWRSRLDRRGGADFPYRRAPRDPVRSPIGGPNDAWPGSCVLIDDGGRRGVACCEACLDSGGGSSDRDGHAFETSAGSESSSSPFSEIPSVRFSRPGVRRSSAS